MLNDADGVSAETSLREERDRLRLLLEVTNLLVAKPDLGQLFEALSGGIRRVIPHEWASVTLIEPEGLPHAMVRLVVLDGVRRPDFENWRIQVLAPEAKSGEPLCTTIEEGLLRNPTFWAVIDARGLKRFMHVHLVTGRGNLGFMTIGTRRTDEFAPSDVSLLTQVAAQVAIAVDNGFAYEEIRQLKDRLAMEKSYLEEDLRSDHDFTEIIGQSGTLIAVLRQVETVAATGATVLITGETGTGKELIARAIHDRSGRRGRAFVRVNCAAIPSPLLESEMFGHERGAFTGAVTARVGRFEVADGGTLFLDEVGDLPLDVQPKLLRAVQEQEFERLGGSRTLRVDTRVIAATNRPLLMMVADNEFRQDLYYRLNVFPIHLPALRERREDIPALVGHFVRKQATRLRRVISAIPQPTMDALTAADWPGNIRELENVIERAVILATDGVLRVPPLWPAEAVPIPARRSATSAQRLDQVEQQAIVAALRATGGVIGGPGGAAARLGIKRTTLQSRMLKLGIAKPGY